MAHIIADEVRVLQKIEVHTNDVTCMQFHGTNILCTGSGDKTIRVFKWRSGDGFVEEPFSPLRTKMWVTDMKISPKGGVLASTSVDGQLILWDIQNGEQQDILFQNNNESIRTCAFSPNGDVIVTGDDAGHICIWGQSRTIVEDIKFHEESITTLAFSQDSAIMLSACSQGNIRMYDVDKGFKDLQPVCSLDSVHDLGVTSADFCSVTHTDPSDNLTRCYTFASCGTDQLLKIWRIYYTGHARSNDGGKFVVSRLIPKSLQEHLCGSAAIYPTEIMNAECVLSVQAHGSSVTYLKFNAAGTLLFTCGMDKAVKVWNLQGNCLRTLGEHTRYVNTIAINFDCSLVASGSNDRTVLIWDISGQLTKESNLSSLRQLLFKFASNQGEVPIEYLCPITHEIMKDPVIVEDGFNYERSAIEQWLSMKQTSPMTNLELATTETIENVVLRGKIEKYLLALDLDVFQQ
ncbi:WD repeat, SAM and U-box domain-containing protein 1-like isoform X2 [Culicoides brevitarsis]